MSRCLVLDCGLNREFTLGFVAPVFGRVVWGWVGGRGVGRGGGCNVGLRCQGVLLDEGLIE